MTSEQPVAQSVPSSDPLMDVIRQWVRSNLGISYADDRTELLRSRVQSLCESLHISVDILASRVVCGEPRTVAALADAVSTGHTYFCREKESFELLERQILPSLPDEPIRIWSAACSSGEEACSIAMSVLNVLSPERASMVKILGTDLSEPRLRMAESAIYLDEQFKLVDPDRLAAWSEPVEGGRRRMSDRIRAMCTFRRMNLVNRSWPFEKRFHVIFLRNVLYYFDEATRTQVIRACFEAAEPGAWLITSLTEPLSGDLGGWRKVTPSVWRKSAVADRATAPLGSKGTWGALPRISAERLTGPLAGYEARTTGALPASHGGTKKDQ